MSELTRRELFIAFGAAGLLHGASYTPRFFTPHEYAAVRLLADFIIPADENSKGAMDAGAAEFIDFICSHSDKNGGYCRYNLGWIDEQMQGRCGAHPSGGVPSTGLTLNLTRPRSRPGQFNS